MLFNLLEDTQQNPITLILFGVIIVGMIALLVWQSVSGKKKQKEAQDMVNALKKGDRVKTIGGVCGFVYEINNDENTFVLETGSDDNKSYVKFDKAAIYQTAPAQGNAVKAEPAKEQATEEVKEEAKAEEVKPEANEEVVAEPAKKPAKKTTKKKAEKVEEAKEEPTAEAEKAE